ncbi:hypothetical protein CIHG_05804 [Coccidioides immitis H538.4]|uniref:Uncharacterized protein n=3 Tax=Coccidioides immitis TaxID=5501 RepID=A0A0J8QTS2_COCIT|nr:hypothetical protein CIRG_01873 [Coccidioides immitis RMSCC 2394]KMU76284.1 hypothetical protein CISG_01019 [Coccidioides immitis RMSCC 3703]KMU88037.1 hypothetical protein CIHG_05804 [Coccidioides immitis H538.4]
MPERHGFSDERESGLTANSGIFGSPSRTSLPPVAWTPMSTRAPVHLAFTLGVLGLSDPRRSPGRKAEDDLEHRWIRLDYHCCWKNSSVCRRVDALLQGLQTPGTPGGDLAIQEQ